MEDALEEILLRTTDRDIRNLRETSWKYNKSVELIEKKQEYWRKRLCVRLKFNVWELYEDSWKIMYEKVIRNRKDFCEMVGFDYTEIVNGMMKRGKDPSVFGNFPLHLACQQGFDDIVKLFLADYRINFDKGSVISVASKYGRLSAVKLLLEDGRDNPRTRDNEAIVESCRNNHVEIVKLLLKDPRINPFDQANEAFKTVCARGYTQLAKLLLEDSRVDPSDQDDQAFRFACHFGKSEIVELLLRDKRIDPACYDNMNFGMAATNGHFEIVKILLQDSRVDPAFDCDKILTISASMGYRDVVELILEDPRINGRISEENLEKYERLLNKNK